MARTRIAGALAVVVLASCSVEEPEKSLPVLRPPVASQAEAKEGSDGSQTTPVLAANTRAAENAGLRADFAAP